MQKRKINFTKIKFGILVVLILIIVAVYITIAIKGYSFSEGIKTFVTSNPRLSPVIFTGLYFVSAFFPLPLLTVFGSTIFGFWEVFICSMIGNIANATIVFYLARWLGRDFVKHFEAKHKTAKKLDMKFKEHAIRDMVLLRFFYLLPVEIGNFAGGLSGIKYRDYLWGVVIGMTPVLTASILLVKGNLTDNSLMIAISTVIFILLLLMPLLYLSAIKKHTKERYHETKRKVREFMGLRK
jgi:uncharacterized membrane protein YdjX (TVP38/TMEM64 family)